MVKTFNVRPVAIARSSLARLALNFEILENSYWHLPVDDKGHEDMRPVGRGVPSSNLCGTHVSFLVCDQKESHKGVVLNGVDYSDKLVVAHHHLFCNKASCPICFIHGWSVRTARSVTGRLEVASERGFGDIEHLTASVSKEDRELPESVMREKCRRALLVRGVLGGCMIFHGYRIDRKRGVLVWSPHYHVLGFISGGFDICRNCVHARGECAWCHGFKGREVRKYPKDKILVKVLAKRKTIIGTAFYQLNHSTQKVSLKRFHIVTWFGVCGCSKLKGKKLKAVDVCPACASVGVHSEMKKMVYWGKEIIARNVGDPSYKRLFAMDEFDGSGLPNFVDAGGGHSE